MDENQPSGRSHLFLVRLWLDEEGSIGASEKNHSHGKKCSTLISEELPHFSDWSSLIDLLASLASTSSAPPITSPVVGPALLADSEGDESAG